MCDEWCIRKDLEGSVRCQIESLFRHFPRRAKEKGRKTVWRVFGSECELSASRIQVETVVDCADVLRPVFSLFVNLFLICYSSVNFHWTTNPAYVLLHYACLDRCYIRCTQFPYFKWGVLYCSFITLRHRSFFLWWFPFITFSVFNNNIPFITVL